MSELALEIMTAMLRAVEFWSTVIGAIVGGTIALGGQLISVRAVRKQREQDIRFSQNAVGHSLLFKMIKIHSNIYGIHKHVEGCFEKAAKQKFEGEPWRLVLPIANPPEPVHFSADEMGMLLAQKDDDAFNLVLSMDVIHNSLIEAIKVFHQERQKLIERLSIESAEGNLVSGNLDREQMLAIRPIMFSVNGLIEHIRHEAKKGSQDSLDALNRLNKVLRDKLRLAYKLNSKFEQTNGSD